MPSIKPVTYQGPGGRVHLIADIHSVWRVLRELGDPTQPEYAVAVESCSGLAEGQVHRDVARAAFVDALRAAGVRVLEPRDQDPAL